MGEGGNRALAGIEPIFARSRRVGAVSHRDPRVDWLVGFRWVAFGSMLPRTA